MSYKQACIDLEKATEVMEQLLQKDEVAQYKNVMSPKQACKDLEKATQSIIQILQNEVEKGVVFARSLTEQVEANKQLKLKIDELQKQLEEKDNLLTQANQTLSFLEGNHSSLTQTHQGTTTAEVHVQLKQPVSPNPQGAPLSPDTKSQLVSSDIQTLLTVPVSVIKQEKDDHDDDCKTEPIQVPVTSSDAKAAKKVEPSGSDDPDLLTENGSRKRGRPRVSSPFARPKAKASRYSGNRTAASIACTHYSSRCAAASLTETDLLFINRQLYCISEKVKQDAFLLSQMNIMLCKRRKRQVELDERRRQRDLSIKYTVIKEDKTRVIICQASFLSIFCVTKDRVCRVAKYWFETGQARPENRGGHRGNIDLSENKQMARLHIQSLALRASHYGRRGKKFLPSDLSVIKLHRMFLEQNPEHLVSYSLYWSMFVYDFNLAFGHPAKDVCSPCVKFRMALKDCDLTAEAKRNTILKYVLHKRRARQFYDTLNEVRDSFTVCFDIMENLVLPKSATGQTSDCQQLNFYVFGVSRHHGRGKAQSRQDVSLYTWLEYENANDSNVIVSALHHYLTTVAEVDLRQCQNLRLFSDSCYANMNVLSMLFALHSQMFPQLNVTHSFPMQGHSFLPVHRLFGRIEQDIRKHTTFLLPDEYINILRIHGIVHQYGKDWRCCDFKKEAATFTTAPRSFEISDARVVQICGDEVGLKPAFVGEFSQHSVLKRGKKWSQFKPAPLPDVNCVKGAKKADVLKLLGEFGVSTAVQEFYERVMSDAGDEDIEQDLQDGDEDKEKLMNE